MHEYMRRLNVAIAHGMPDRIKGGLTDIKVMHERNCGIYSGEECNCDPHISFDSHGKRYSILNDGRFHNVGATNQKRRGTPDLQGTIQAEKQT